MSSIYINMPDLVWRKARRSAANGECVEVAKVEDGIIVRDSKNLDGIILMYKFDKWHSFIEDRKAFNQGPGQD